MFESFCALLLRLYPAEFRRAYGREAMQLLTDRARHERGLQRRVRLLMDLAIDLGTTVLHGWQSGKPLLVRADGPLRFEIIDSHGPRPEALAAGMLASLLMFAAFTLLLQPKALTNALAYLGERSGLQTPGADSDHSTQQTIAAAREAHHALIAAIAANLRQRYVDRAFGRQLADALLARDRRGEYASLAMDAALAARINRDIQTTGRALGIPRGVFVANVVYSARPLPTLADKPVYVPALSQAQSAAEYFVYTLKLVKRATVGGETTAVPRHSGRFYRINDHFGIGVQEAAPSDNSYPVKGPEVTGIEPDAEVSRTEGLEAATGLIESRAVAQLEAFEAISIRPAGSGDPRNMRLRVLANGDLHASALPVFLLIRYAYDVPVNASPRFSGFPGWREAYDIEAKAPVNAIPPGLSEREKLRRTQGMVRALLADRFKLVMRVEQKRMPVYALIVASGGPNLQKSTIAENDCMFDTGIAESCHHFIAGRGHPLTARAVDMDDLAHYIENWTDLPVVNRTAVSGLFAVETQGWRPMQLPPPPPGAPLVGFDDLPTIFTVLQKLGLELKQQEATVPVYTVEHIERPGGE